MEPSNFTEKFKTLGYDRPEDLSSSFNDLVVKLEEDYIRRYSASKLAKFKSSRGSDWNKSLKNYLNELKLNLPEDFFKGNKLDDEDKLYVLNKLLNLAVKSKYESLSEENKISDCNHDLKKVDPPLNESHQSFLDKLNCVLEKHDLPLLDSNCKPSEVKSAVQLYLKSCQSNNVDSHNDQHTNQSAFNESLRNFSKNADFEKEFTHLLRTMYTEDLCNLQSEIIWLTKEFSKLPQK